MFHSVVALDIPRQLARTGVRQQSTCCVVRASFDQTECDL